MRSRKKGLELKALCESTAQRVNEFAAELKDIEMHLQSDNEMLRGLTASIVTPSAWETTVDAMAYDTELHELEAKLTKAEQTTDERYFAAQKRMDELNAQLASGDTRAAVEAQIKALDKRIEELKARNIPRATACRNGSAHYLGGTFCAASGGGH